MKNFFTPYNIMLIVMIALYPALLFIGLRYPETNLAYVGSTVLIHILLVATGIRDIRSDHNRTRGIILTILAVVSFSVLLYFWLI